MKLALLLAAVDWRLGVLLRGDKGAGKTTTARGLAALLPAPARFINLPHRRHGRPSARRLAPGARAERRSRAEARPALRGPRRRPLRRRDQSSSCTSGRRVLDAAVSGVNVVEREGFSAIPSSRVCPAWQHEPGGRFAAPAVAGPFRAVGDGLCSTRPSRTPTRVERRIAFERDPVDLPVSGLNDQQPSLTRLQRRASLADITCSSDIIATD